MLNPQEIADDLIAEGYSKAEAWRMVRDILERRKGRKPPKPIPIPDRTEDESHE